MSVGASAGVMRSSVAEMILASCLALKQGSIVFQGRPPWMAVTLGKAAVFTQAILHLCREMGVMSPRLPRVSIRSQYIVN